MNATRLLQLAEFLERLPPEDFDFNYVVKDYDKAKDCGTVCCAVGWCPTIFKTDWKWDTDPDLYDEVEGDAFVSLLRAGSTGSTLKDAAIFFGIDYRESTMLFVPGMARPWAPRPELRLGVDATPFAVATSIREFVRYKSL